MANYNDTPVNFSDRDIERLSNSIETHDVLNTRDYAMALAEFIKVCDTPMTIGIQGDWGMGKTSMLNMVQAFLKASGDKQYGLIDFNTWHYSLFGQDEYLGIAAIRGILNRLRKQFDISDDKGLMEKTSKAIGKVLKSTQFSAFGVSMNAGAMNKPDPDNVQFEDISQLMLSFKTDFRNLIDHIITNCTIDGKPIDRIVFFIDDLDRVKPIKALELLESLKNFLDVENCVFMLAVDYEVVQRGMAEKFGVDLQKLSGKSFFDKIIQLPFTMPSTSYNLGNYIKQLLANANFKVTDRELNFYEEITTVTVGRNPRSIKRVINYVRLIRIIRKEYSTIDTKDSAKNRKILYALICMQVAWPEIFNFFVKSPTPTTIKNIENWEYLDQIPFIDKLYNRTPNIDQLKANISAFFDIFFELLDTEEDSKGVLTRSELKPVWDILRVARLTVEKDFREPLDVFTDIVHKNDRKGEFKKALKIYRQSKWATGSGIDYKLSGKRYVTIVYNRKQIGSLVTLVTRPLVFRIDIDEFLLKEGLIDEMEKEDIYTGFINALQKESLTGYGDTLIDLDDLYKHHKSQSVRVLNILFQLVSRQIEKKIL
ncbi:P-loop NTPase fold protein [Balneola sp. MJW-20]|uniref:KAP family P-loop NTPase fold protein n=1 Tax=Gracilimonas aurantiaca TaxID=3234185 RepID=UPI00390A6AEB